MTCITNVFKIQVINLIFFFYKALHIFLKNYKTKLILNEKNQNFIL